MKMLLTEEYYEKCVFHRKEYEKIIIIFQVGKFYEAYSHPEKDLDVGSARDLSMVLHMALTKKNKKKEADPVSNPYQCGFPTYSLMKHITRMNDMGFTVALYDQSQDPLDKKRKLRGIYTENIRKEFMDQEEGSSCVVYAYGIEKYDVQEGRHRHHEYRQYYTHVQMTSGKIYFFESKDSDLVRMMDKFFVQNQPQEILVYTENISKEDVAIIRRKIEANSKTLHLREWNFYNTRRNTNYSLSIENYEMHQMERHPHMEDLLEKLLEHIQHHDILLTTNLVIAEDAWKVEGLHSFLHFNRDLFRELFLFDMSSERQQSVDRPVKSIYDMLRKGMNTMASRYFSQLLRYPTCDVDEIRKIQNHLLKPVEDDKLKLLRSLPDVEWYFLRWKRGNLNYHLVASLLEHYRHLETYYPELHAINQDVARLWNLERMEKYPHLLLLYDDFFERNELEVQMHIDPLRQEVLTLYTKFEQMETNDLRLICKDEVEEYYFEIAVKKYQKWSAAQKKLYQELDKNTGVVRLLPHTLVQTRTEMAKKQKQLIAKHVELYHCQVKRFLDQHGATLLALHEQWVKDSTFGVLQRFFEKNAYVCPNVENTERGSFMKVKELRHALIEYLSPNKLYTPCDCEIDHDQHEGKLIYGENASGKSTYMKAIGTALWLAQCGLFVPAQEFVFSPYERIYSKFSHFDNLFRGHSLFVAEMNELQYMLKNSGSSTLLLLDELMSGTEIHSGSSLIVAVLEDFLTKHISFCFTTHIHWIGSYLEKKYSSLETFHFVYDSQKDLRNEKLIATNIDDFYDRRIHRGSGPSLYGIEVAKQVGIPASIIERAHGYRDRISLEFLEPCSKENLSRYNPKFVLQKCFVCGTKRRLHTHHIFPQKEFVDGPVKHFQKNALYNLIALCEGCHMKVHQENEV